MRRRSDPFDDDRRRHAAAGAHRRQAAPQVAALELAATRIRAYHEIQKPGNHQYVDDAGVTLGWQYAPLESVGIYVPGGKASYPSSVLMNAIPATVAGVERIVMVVPTPEGPVAVSGRIAPPPGKLYEFAASGSGAIRQNLDLSSFAGEIGRPLATVTVQQAGPPSDGLLRDWPEAASGTGKHCGYAFQWFGLSGLLTVLYVWFQFIAPWRSRRAAARRA